MRRVELKIFEREEQRFQSSLIKKVFPTFFSVSIVDFEELIVCWVILPLTLQVVQMSDLVQSFLSIK